MQRDRIEAEIVAWGFDKHSWSVDYRIFYGDIADPAFREKVYGEITGKQYRHRQREFKCFDDGGGFGYTTQKFMTGCVKSLFLGLWRLKDRIVPLRRLEHRAKLM